MQKAGSAIGLDGWLAVVHERREGGKVPGVRYTLSWAQGGACPAGGGVCMGENGNQTSGSQMTHAWRTHGIQLTFFLHA